jgi:GTP-binding protein
VKPPGVVIVGRPNVGKSALFNRLVGRRVAIVHEQSGVTRDRLICEVNWAGERFDLVDTGGLANLESESLADPIEAGIRRQVETAMNEAAAAILVVDVDAGRLPLDEQVAAWLHRCGRPTVVAVNKADNAGRDDGVAEFHRLGFPVFPVSAMHGRGVEALMGAVLAALPDAPPEEAAPPSAAPPLKVAVVGRPNVGKSCYVNRLLRADRVIVSPVPGTTRDSVDIPFVVGTGPTARRYVLIDTAGIRANGKIDTSVEFYGRTRTESSIQRADIIVLMLDAISGPTAQDKKIGAVIEDHRKGCVMVVNKWDLNDSVSQREYEPALRHAVPFLAHCPVVFVSAQSGYNVRRSLDVIDGVADRLHTRLPTPALTRALLEGCRRVQPPSSRGRTLKVFYAAQTGTAPPAIRIFVNHADRVLPSFRAFFERCVRERFDLHGVPLSLRFVSRRDADETASTPPPRQP